MRLIIPVIASFALAACATTPQPSGRPAPPTRPPVQAQPVLPTTPPPPPVEGFMMPQIMRGAGLEGVIEANAAALTRQFGSPRLNVAEGDMRKLQFSAPACVMNIYLYPLRPDAEPVATWLETHRASDGAEVDRFACMQALRRNR